MSIKLDCPEKKRCSFMEAPLDRESEVAAAESCPLRYAKSDNQIANELADELESQITHDCRGSWILRQIREWRKT